MALDPNIVYNTRQIDTVSPASQMLVNQQTQRANVIEDERLQMERERAEIAKIKQQYDMASEVEKKEALQDIDLSYRIANAQNEEAIDRLLSENNSEHAMEMRQLWETNRSMDNKDLINSAREDLAIAELIGIIETPKSNKTSGTEFERMKDRWIELENKGENRTPLETEELGVLKQAVETKARGGMNPEQRAFGTKLGGARGEDYANLEQTLADSNTTMNQLDLALDAVNKLGWRQGPIIGRTWDLTPEAQLLNSEGIKESLKYVNQTKGAVSDKEMALFKSAAIGTDRKKEFNEDYINMAKSILQRKVQQAEFYQAWYEQNGTLEGAAKEFKKFADENPVFEKKGDRILFLGQGSGTSSNSYKSKYGLE